nr:2Fe-2S iron-sulfur cluster-binding protein [Rhodococcus jostii]
MPSARETGAAQRYCAAPVPVRCRPNAGESCSCATCHVLLDEDSTELFDEERDPLEYLEGVQPHSRLACQLIVNGRCDGVRVVVPDTSG